ncbi:MAG: hypothetical protein HYZ29_28430 [Myxococcales bacterium]|nr:hypothetical protein [Myxococcales bacterium]
MIGLSSALALGCGSDADPADAPLKFEYPRDAEIRINQLQAKGSHNSYHVETEGMTVTALKYTHAPLGVQLAEQGVRKVELDTRFDLETGEHYVVHIPLIDEQSNCRRLVDCLKALSAWSKKNPAHHPLFVQIEPKDGLPKDPEERFAALHDEILSQWDRSRILTPDDVRGAAATLREALVTGGWPTLGQARGKVLFYVDESGKWRDAYTHGGKHLEGRLMFASSEPGADYEATYVINDPTSTEIGQRVKEGFIVRTRADADNVEPLAGDTQAREAALASGAQLISTDYPAPVDGVNYLVEIPGGTPSRCNPLVAPAGCTSEDIENPAFIR